jgi:small subunit ribosomal protein S15
MAFQAQEKTDIVTKFAVNEGDTGSTRVQVALITERLKYLLDHFKTHPKDHHSRRGLLKIVGRRKRLLEYMKKQDIQGYRDLIQELGIRK